MFQEDSSSPAEVTESSEVLQMKDEVPLVLASEEVDSSLEILIFLMGGCSKVDSLQLSSTSVIFLLPEDFAEMVESSVSVDSQAVPLSRAAGFGLLLGFVSLMGEGCLFDWLTDSSVFFALGRAFVQALRLALPFDNNAIKSPAEVLMQENSGGSVRKHF